MDLNKLLAFDLEIAKEIPAYATDWQRFEPLGISCLAQALSVNIGGNIQNSGCRFPKP